MVWFIIAFIYISIGFVISSLIDCDIDGGLIICTMFWPAIVLGFIVFSWANICLKIGDFIKNKISEVIKK